MATIGNWVVGVTLKFKSNTGTELTEINKGLKALREGEISRTQKAFGALGDKMLTLGKKMDADGKVSRNVFNSLAKGLTLISEKTGTATESVVNYAKAFDGVKIAQGETFNAIKSNIDETAAYTRLGVKEVGLYSTVFKAVKTQQADTFDALKTNISSTTQRTNNATAAMGRYVKSLNAAGNAPIPHGPGFGYGGGGGGRGGSGGTGGASGGSGGGGNRLGRFGNWYFGGGHHVGQFATALGPSALAGGINGYMIGMAIKDGIGSALSESAQFQNAFVGTSQTMGATSPAQRDMLYKAVMGTSSRTGVSGVETMRSMQDIGRLTVGTMPFEQSVSLLEPLTRYAKVLEVTRGLDPHKSINAAVEQLHLMQQYKPQQAAPLLNQILAMGEMMPQDPEKTVTQLKQFAPALLNLGVSTQQIMAIMTWVARAGLGTGRGGTGVRELGLAVLKPAAITSSLQIIKDREEEKMFGPKGWKQFYTPGKKGKAGDFNMVGMIQAIGQYAQAHPGPETMAMIYNVFGRQGGTIAQLAANPDTARVLSGTMKAMQSPSLTTDQMYGSLMGNYDAQQKRLSTAWHNIEVEIGLKLLPSMSKMFGSLADTLINLQGYIHRNPAALISLGQWIESFGKGIRSFSTFVGQNPDFMHGVGEFSKYMAILAGIRITGSILGFFGQITMIAPLLTMLGSAMMPWVRAITFAAALSGGTLTTMIGVPLAIAALVAAIGLAIFFPKQFHRVLTSIESFINHMADAISSGLGTLAADVVKWVASKFHFGGDPADPTGKGKPGGGKAPARDDSAMLLLPGTKLYQWAMDHVVHPAQHSYQANMPRVPAAHPSTKHLAPHAEQHAQVGAAQVHLAFNGPIYGMDDFKKKVADVMADLAKNPMNVLGTNLSPTRTHPNIPQILAVGKA